MEENIDVFHTKIVGVSFEQRQYVIQTIARLEEFDKSRVELLLVREPNNQYDPYAIAVYARYEDSNFLTEVTKQVGYIKKDLAQKLSEDIDTDSPYDYVITDYDTTGGKGKSRGLNIQIVRKEKTMAKLSVKDLLKQRGGARKDFADVFIKPSVDLPQLTVRFLKPLEEAYIQGTHFIDMPAGWPKRKEVFECLKYLNMDDEAECPADQLDQPAVYFVLPVIDRADGKVKLFKDTRAVFRNFETFSGEPASDAEKAFKIGDLTRADIQIIQTGERKTRKVMCFPHAASIRDLNAEELKLLETAPNPRDFVSVKTKDEIQAIVDTVIAAKNGQTITANSGFQD
jgi:hypothetical protein